jgi:hypothetical protein
VTPLPDRPISLALSGVAFDELTRALGVPTGCGALEHMRFALQGIAAEARARRLPVEVLAQTVKDAFHIAVRPSEDTPEEWERRYYVALTYGLELYFDKPI